MFCTGHFFWLQGSPSIPESLVKTALWFNLAILFPLAYFLMMDHGAKFSLGKHAASIWSGISVVGCIQDTVCHDMLFVLGISTGKDTEWCQIQTTWP